MKLTHREEFFRAFGFGPWKCDDDACDEPVFLSDLHVHHLDHSGKSKHPNNDPSNLVPMHSRCHWRRHRVNHHDNVGRIHGFVARAKWHEAALRREARLRAEGRKQAPPASVRCVCGLTTNPGAMAMHQRACALYNQFTL